MNTQSVTPKRLALFFDGTWNEPENNTNVWRSKLMLADRSGDGLIQKAFYDEGVGTHWWDALTGGAFGAGLSANIRQGYRWLMENYDPGDEIFVFGFSRGAFTARSLVGLIAKCGLLKPEAPMSFAQAFDRYKKGKDALPIYTLKYLENMGEQKFSFEEEVLLKHSYYHRDLIKLVGVWDTVGSIGVPFGDIKGISSRTLQFHDTHLSKVAQHSYQALALDEFRKPYWAILWTRFIPDIPDPVRQSLEENRFVEQRWFSGSHCNIGGGYRDDLMMQRPLAWIQGKANGCGLAFRSEITLDEEDLTYLPRDSYSEFLWGLWKMLTLERRYVRWVQPEPVKKEKGMVRTVNERIDKSVFERCKMLAEYRPASLQEWSKRKGIDLESVIQNPDEFPALWSPVATIGLDK
ncbi:MAG: DUF2235 domain-containing protein [Bacteroidota bacterium]